MSGVLANIREWSILESTVQFTQLKFFSACSIARFSSPVGPDGDEVCQNRSEKVMRLLDCFYPRLSDAAAKLNAQ